MQLAVGGCRRHQVIETFINLFSIKSSFMLILISLPDTTYVNCLETYLNTLDNTVNYMIR
jgi:hypothetical protein